MKKIPAIRQFLEEALTSDTDECILWPYTITREGHGQLLKDNKRVGAHREVCERAHGSPLTSSSRVAHSCGNPACINPRHLSWKAKPKEFLDEALASDTDECLIWPYGKIRGYGKFKKDGKMTCAHRYICEQTHGSAPTSKHEAAHSCGNPSCINPRHLRWATPKENGADKILHGTAACGERNGSAKLTEAAVLEIREKYAKGDIYQRELAAKWGVSQAVIGSIITRKKWKHL